MKLTPHVIDAMLAAGCTAEQIGAAVKAAMGVDDESQAERREKDRIRKREQRARENVNENNNGVRDVTRTAQDGADNPSPKEKSPTPPKEITPSPVSEARASSTESAREFSEFWSLFPNKVGKREAEKAFANARKRADLDAILAGLRRYAAKTDDRPWCNPSTFLNQNRWEDMPAAPPVRQQTSPPRKPSAFDAYANICRQNGWNPDATDDLPSDHGDAQFVSSERGEPGGTVVDLRPGAFRRIRAGDM